MVAEKFNPPKTQGVNLLTLSVQPELVHLIKQVEEYMDTREAEGWARKGRSAVIRALLALGIEAYCQRHPDFKLTD